jgi:predicted HicB family RNase H-like nuclease
MTRQICRGKILFIDDLVTYEATSPTELQTEFVAAVDDYIDTCTTLGREPQKPLRGQFNVRIPPALHRAAALRALADNVSLNDVAVRALDAFVNIQSVVNHNVRVTLDIPEESMKTLVSSASTQTQWGTAHVH